MHSNTTVSRPMALGVGLLATIAAALATAGDFTLLAHGAARGLGDRIIDSPSLVAGHLLGVLCIPFYGAGFWLAARSVSGAGSWSRWIFPIGLYAGAVGAAIHGVTAVLIETNITGAGGGSPWAVPHVLYLAPLWAVVFAAMAAASGLFAIAVIRGETGLPGWTALVTPAPLVVVIAFAATPFPAAAAFLAPAAPNLAHLMFFAALTMVSHRQPRTG